jgi:hypothetical protein
MMSVTKLPLTLELTKPVTLIGDLADEFPSEYDAKTQLCSQTRSAQQSNSVNRGAVQVDVLTVDVQVDDVLA